MATTLPLSAKTLYAELREQMLAYVADPSRVPDQGSFVTKTFSNGTYGYYQFRDLTGKQRQHYLGPLSDDAIAGLRDRFEQRESSSESRITALARAVRQLTGPTVDAKTFKVMQAFVESGVFHDQLGGGVLVGTHAFNALGPVLGVSWQAMTVTDDIDLAADAAVRIAIAPKDSATPQSTLESLQMGFAPVPSMNPKGASTSFQTKTHAMRVDLLTTTSGAPGGTQYIPALNSYAEKVPFMDFLLHSPIRAPLIGPRKAVLINLPSPERFALHKLIVSESRPVVMASKSEKDRRQALAVLGVLMEEHPDSLEQALADLIGRGKSWRKRLKRALAKCHPLDPSLIDEIDELLRELDSPEVFDT